VSGEDLLIQKTHFAFGKNWLQFAAKVDEARIAQAVRDLQRLSGLSDLRGKSFLDIGCGSGLHALAAHRMGATRIFGTDIDPDSVEASTMTFSRFAAEASARFEVCSVFDMRPARFGTFDVVYSWGVLHHTGDMERAIACAAALVAPEGVFLVALYRKTPFCALWRRLKRWYSRATPTVQARARSVYVALRRLATTMRGRDFDAYVRDYGKSRGMDFYNDVHDWLGGYPYESISPPRYHALLTGLGFSMDRQFVARSRRYLPGLLGSGCDEYAFRRQRL
jgi:SAM-dependent methyltransferase